MFNLIITIIAIALVVVLTATSVYYGGSAFTNGSQKAIAATFVNQAQQLVSAATVYRTREGSMPADIDALIDDGYLSSAPQSPAVSGPMGLNPGGDSWVLDDNLITGELAFNVAPAIGPKMGEQAVTVEVCSEIDDMGNGVVECDIIMGSVANIRAVIR